MAVDQLKKEPQYQIAMEAAFCLGIIMKKLEKKSLDAIAVKKLQQEQSDAIMIYLQNLVKLVGAKQIVVMENLMKNALVEVELSVCQSFGCL